MSKASVFFIALISAAAVGGCATRGDSYWYRAQSTPEQARTDLSQCRFEAEKAVASYGPGPRTFGLVDSLSQGIAQGLDIAARKDRVGTLCMQAKGYSLRHRGVEDDVIDRTIVASPVAAKMVAPPAAAPLPAPLSTLQQQPVGYELPVAQKPEGPIVSAIGEWSFGAERLAKNTSCTPQPIARLTGKGPGVETFAITCLSGDVLAVRCEYGQCRILR